MDIVACDVADRAAVQTLFAKHPAVGAVFHTAGVLDDGLSVNLTPEQLTKVLRPKVHAATHLHEATLNLGLSHFVLFSSAAGVLGDAGQANYAAANTFLDELARRRRAQGLPGLSLSWGLWDNTSGMTGHLSDAERSRMAADGMRPLSAEHALGLLDAAMTSTHPHYVPIALTVGTQPEPLFRALTKATRSSAHTAVGHDRSGRAAGRAQRGTAAAPDRNDRRGAGEPRAGARRGACGRPGPAVQDPGFRLADRGRAAEPAATPGPASGCRRR